MNVALIIGVKGSVVEAAGELKASGVIPR